jgi:hypothetical protein
MVAFEHNPKIESDLAVYRDTYGLPACVPTGLNATQARHNRF